MRAFAIAVLSVLLLAGCADTGLRVPTAHADPATEEPPAPTTTHPPARDFDEHATVFPDTPDLVDARPVAFQSWSAADGGLRVYFTTGTPQCYGVHATVRENAEQVVVSLRGGTLPAAAGRPCIMIAVSGALDIPLADPVGGRDVVSET